MSFLIYDGKVAIALLVFYLFYRFLLKKETFHRFNRMVLVGTAVLSFLLPLCIITIHKPIEVDSQAIVLSELPVDGMPAVAETSAPWWMVALSLSILFWAGVAFVLVRVLVSILSIIKIVRTGEQVLEEDGCKVIVTERDIDPFSWMKYIVLSRKDWEGDHAAILAHEKAHIILKHSREILLVDILSLLQWFNPAIWMLRADLQELHEYEADGAVLRAGTNIKEYQYLLIRKAVGKSGYSVANSFNHSILKNRITMMSKSKSPLSRGWRVLWMLPLVCLGIGLQARTVYVPTGEENNRKGLIVLRIDESGTVTLDGREISREEIAKELTEHIRSLNIPKWLISVQVEADENAPEDAWKYVKDGFSAAGVAEFKHNSVKVPQTPLYILREVWGEEKEISAEEAQGIDKNRIKSIEMLDYAQARKEFGEKYGHKVSDGVCIINMKSKQELNEIIVVRYADDKDDATTEDLIPFVLANPDTMPTFQGGDMNNFSRWLNQRIVVPKSCKHSGTMKISFVVDAKGNVGGVQIAEGVCEELDAMMLSLVEQSPKWEPAKHQGKPTPQVITLPVVFQMR